MFAAHLLLLIISAHCLCMEKKKPNVVVFVADDWGWGDFGLHGADDIRTPNMDAFAYHGVSLSNYYTMPLCTPSRSALMTGMHPVHIGMQHEVIRTGEPWGLPLNYKILPQYLKDEGYKTYAVGKWHLGNFKAAYTPTRRGFDYHFGYWQSHQSYSSHKLWDTLHNVEGYDMRDGLNTSWDLHGHYATDLFTSKAINQIISHNASEPMFLYLAHLAVHVGKMQQLLEAPAHTVNKFSYIKDIKRRLFAAMISKLDDSFGKIIATLGHRNMLSNTIIVLTTDNGGASPPYEDSAASNWPLRGGKESLWEGGIRGNAAIWSAQLPASKVSNHLMHIEDWLPTLLGAINSTHLYKNDLKLDGRNMWPVLMGEQTNSYDELILNIDPVDDAFAYRRGDYKILHGNFKLNKWTSPHELGSPYDYLEDIRQSVVTKIFNSANFPLSDDELIVKVRGSMSPNCTLLLPCVHLEDGEQTSTSSRPLCNPCNASQAVCLYNLKEDPCEMNNLAQVMPEVVESLQAQMRKFRMMEPLNKAWDPRSNPQYWNGTFNNWCDYVEC